MFNLFGGNSTLEAPPAPQETAPKPAMDLQEDQLSKMGYNSPDTTTQPTTEAGPDPLQRMGYNRSVDTAPEPRVVPFTTGETTVPPIVTTPEVVAPVGEHTIPPVAEVVTSAPPVNPEAVQTMDDLRKRVSSLEAQLAALGQPGQGSEKFSKMMYQFGVSVGTKLAGLEKFWNGQVEKSPIVKFARRMERSIEAIKAGKAGFEEAYKKFLSESSTPANAAPSVDQMSKPEAPVTTPEVSPELKTATPEVTQPLKAEEIKNPEKKIDANLLRESYEKITADPADMDLVSKIEEFTGKHGHSSEAVQEILTELLGEEKVEALNTIREVPGAMEYLKELKDLNLSNEKANKLIEEKFSLKKGEDSSSDDEDTTKKEAAPVVANQAAPAATPEAATQTAAAPKTEQATVPAAEAAKTTEVQTPQPEQARVLSEAERQEARRREMRELITNQKGRSESDLSVGEQIRQHQLEYNRLGEMAAKQPPEELQPSSHKVEEVRTENGAMINASVGMEYEGDLSNPNALKGAIADQALKMDIKRALLDSQMGENLTVDDQLAVFRSNVAELLGDQDMVELDRGNLKKFVPGEDSLMISYEKGKLKLTVRPLSLDGSPTKPNNAFDNSFRYE